MKSGTNLIVEYSFICSGSAALGVFMMRQISEYWSALIKVFL